MKRYSVFIILALLVHSCTEDVLSPINPSQSVDLSGQSTMQEIPASPITLSTNKSGSIEQFLIDVNAGLSIQDAGIQLSAVEYLSNEEAGNTVFFNNTGNKQLTGDFVPNDPRRLSGDDILYALDGTQGSTSSGLSQAQTDAAILSAMNTWNTVSCSGGLDVLSIGITDFDLGYVEALLGIGGAFLFTDLMHSVFNTDLFDAIFGPGSSVLGVTFTFVFTDDDGNPTDIDNNGKDDVAFRDIYYNDEFSWAIGDNIDVETVALHEAGHGLSQQHFGKAFTSGGNNKLHFAPRAVMNAGYTGVQPDLLGTDNAGHCSNWSQWPSN